MKLKCLLRQIEIWKIQVMSEVLWLKYKVDGGNLQSALYNYLLKAIQTFIKEISDCVEQVYTEICEDFVPNYTNKNTK